MARPGPGETTERVPVRKGLRKTQIGSDVPSARFVKESRDGQHEGRNGNRRGRDTPNAALPAIVTPSLLVCFSGKIGSGKTSISCAVARWLECGRTSFGDYLRDEVARRGG